MSSTKRILIYRIGHLGDTLVSLPAFWAVRKSFPKSHLTLLTNSNFKNQQYILAQDVLPRTDLFDEILSYSNETSKIQTVQAFTKLFIELRQRKFDCVIYLTTRNRTQKQIKRDVTFFRLAGIKRIIGTENLLKNLLDSAVARPLPAIESEIDYLMKCLVEENFLSISAEQEIKPELLLTKAERETADNWLEINCLEFHTNKRLIAVAPSSKWESKIWAEDRFAEVVEKLILQKNIFPVVFGGIEDREIGNRLLKRWKTGANAAGELNIRQAAAALSECLFYLGNDTGTMHLAASVGVPCVAVFSAIDWSGRWKPFGKNHRIFREIVPCEGCLSSICKFERQCLDAVTAENVLKACLNILEKAENENSYFNNQV